MAIRSGLNNLITQKFGQESVSKVYLGNEIVWSEGGSSDWLNINLPIDLPIRDIAYGNNVFVIIAGDPNDTDQFAFTSPDGLTWTQRSLPSMTGYWDKITFGNGKFVVIACNTPNDGVTPAVATSPDGITWTKRSIPYSPNTCTSMVYGNNTFMALGNDGGPLYPTVLLTSIDGITWTRNTNSGLSNEFYDGLSFVNGFFAAANVVPARYETSVNGVSWTQRNQPILTNTSYGLISHIAYGNNLFVAVSGIGTVDEYVISSDGVSWVKKKFPIRVQSTAVAFGDGLFVIAACSHLESGTLSTPSNVAFVSTDGVTWSRRNLGVAALWRKIVHGAQRFVAISQGDSNVAVLPTVPARPSAPTNLTVLRGNAEATLSWTAASENGFAITNHIVEYSSDAGLSWSAFNTTALTANTVIVTGLTNGTAYVFRVAAVNSAGRGNYSTVSTPVTPVAIVRTAVATNAIAGPGIFNASLDLLPPPSLTDATLFGVYPSNSTLSSIYKLVVATDNSNTLTQLLLSNTVDAGISKTDGYNLYALRTTSPPRIEAVNGELFETSLIKNLATADRTPTNLFVKATHASASPGQIPAVLNGTAYVSFSLSSKIEIVPLPSGTSTFIETGEPVSADFVGIDEDNNRGFLANNAAGSTLRVINLTATAAGQTATTLATVDRPITIYPLGSFTGKIAFSDGAYSYLFVLYYNAVCVFSRTTYANVAVIFKNSVQDDTTAFQDMFCDGVNLYVTEQKGINNINVVPGSVYVISLATLAITDIIDVLSTDLIAGNPTLSYIDDIIVADSGIAYVKASQAGYILAVSTQPTPPPPTNVLATVSDAAITVSWTAPTVGSSVPAITDYRVQFSTDSGQTWTTYADTVSTNTNVAIPNTTLLIQNKTSALFRVATINVAGASGYSLPSAAVSLTASAPTSITATARNSSVLLSWTAPQTNLTITGYVIQRSLFDDNTGQWSSWANTITTTNTDITRTITGLTNDRLYAFRVATRNAYGTGPYSIEFPTTGSFAVRPAALVPDTPAAPVVVSAVSSTSQPSITLSWAAPANNGSAITFYSIEASANNGQSWGTFGTSTTTSYTGGTTLSFALTYVFRIRAANDKGYSEWSPASNPVTPTQSNSSALVLSITVGTANSTPKYSINWGGSVSAANVRVEYSYDDGNTWVALSTPSTKPFVVNNLADNVPIVFRGRSTSPWGPYGTTVGPYTYESTPGVPTNVVASVSLSPKISLSWTAPTGSSTLSAYIIEYSTDAGVTWTTYPNTGTATTKNINDLAPRLTYVFRVAAVSSSVVGVYSDNSNAVFAAELPGSPTGVTGTPGSAQVELSWSAPADDGGSAITNYTIQYSSNNGTSWTTFNDGVSTATSTTITSLTDGTPYLFRVAAVNSIGTGPYSTASAAITPRREPNPPTSVSATAGVNQVSLSWLAPTNNGGSPVTDYIIKYTTNNWATSTTFEDGVSTNTTATVTGLTNGTTYVFSVQAVNIVGPSIVTYSNSVAPQAIPPSAPSITSVPAVLAEPSGQNGVSTVTINLSAPSSNGGATITGYEVQQSTVLTFAANGQPATYSEWSVSQFPQTQTPGLFIQTSAGFYATYRFRVRAINSAGAGDWSTPSANVTFSTTSAPGFFFSPEAKVFGFGTPTIECFWNETNFTYFDSALNQTFTYPYDVELQYSLDGGATWANEYFGLNVVTSGTYNRSRYISLPGAGGSAVLIRGRLTITRPDNSKRVFGTYYTPAAINLPISTPGQPGPLTATASTNQAVLNWTAPTRNGGAAVTDYVIQFSSNNGNTWTTFNDGTTTFTSATVTGLINGTPYVFRVAAVNSVGAGFYSQSNSVTPFSVAPGAPTNLSVTAGNTQLSLSWLAPSNGGSAITDYIVQYSSNNGSTWLTFNDGVSTNTAATITGLVNGTQYAIRVAAVNSIGTGSYSANVVATPRTTPAAPTGLTATAGNSQANLSWTAPTNTGGSAISSYTTQYSNDNGVTWFSYASQAGTDIIVFNLTNGTPYVFRVAATNSAGTGPWSTVSTAVTPFAVVPSAPTNVLISSVGISKVTIEWTAGANGGANITNYIVQYSSNGGITWTTFNAADDTRTFRTVTGLTGGTAYIFRVAGVNSVGTGSYSFSSASATPIGVPAAPANFVALSKVSGEPQINLSWSAPANNGGSAVTSYVVQYSSNSGATWTTLNHTLPSLGVTSDSFTTSDGIVENTTYSFRVAAVNIAGTGVYSAVASVLAKKYAEVVNILAGAGPSGVAVNPSTNRVYVCNQSDDTITVINTSTNTVVATIPVLNTPYDVVVNTNTNRVYILYYSGDRITVINGSTNAIVTNITLPVTLYAPTAIAVNKSLNRVYVADTDNSCVRVIDGSNNTVIEAITGFVTSPTLLAVDDTTNKLYVANAAGDIWFINGSNYSVKSDLVGGGRTPNPSGIAINTTTKLLYVCYANSTNVRVYNTDPTLFGNSGVGFITTVPTSGYNFIAADSSSNRIYLNGGSLAVINGATNTVLATNVLSTFMSQTGKMAVNSATQKVYVSRTTSVGVTVLTPN